MRLQISLKLKGFVLIDKSTVKFNFPGNKFGGVRRFASIAVCQTLYQIRWRAGVFPLRMCRASDYVNAPHCFGPSLPHQSVFAPATLDTLRLRLRVAQPQVAEGEAWWARQDSNLRQHRYERCVLTAE